MARGVALGEMPFAVRKHEAGDGEGDAADDGGVIGSRATRAEAAP